MRNAAETIGRNTLAGITELGLAAVLFLESVGWLLTGTRRRQPVRMSAVLLQCVDIGLRAIPIVTVLSFAIGAMVAIQGIHTLSIFGAESQVTVGIALSVTREFAPLITGILVAGRSGSALAARLGTMKINEEISALTVIGINPVRYLVAPALVAMLLMVPLLTWYADMVALLGAGIYVSLELGLSFTAYLGELRQFLSNDDILHGIGKSALFGVLITLVGVVNGLGVSGGAEGVGRMTTRSVVHAISAIVVTDMIFTFLVTR
ncbi:ABC transporter permease [Solimonas sp. K1W22B-7]|uniref:MlaE family ABC transporter permease n=1 Tax=Solimonas sp. K1W22B-7 TaxID=2303331 RepID=UPI000E32E538|nr:ABC transporter permease [Solimonas sp. K1W22B-7]AXQ29759.1 ABC transporter permease [Solimonas sp. K1W22B-7]